MGIHPSPSDTVLLGSSPAMRGVREQLGALAGLRWHVRIEGPTGSGKGLAARVLHDLSPRKNGAFVLCHVNALADGLEVAELVGHTRGAFTGAVADTPGLFETAHRGTLFVDEVSTASSRTQLALLQLVDDGTFVRLGERRTRRVDVRAIFATNGDLEQAVLDKTFREDLFHRLGSLVVRMPALRDHPADIPELAVSILARKAQEAGVERPQLRAQDFDRLVHFDWPGNVRQLGHVLEHLIAFGHLPDLAPRLTKLTPEEWKAHFEEVIRRYADNKAAAARALGISRKALYRRLKQHEA